MRQTHFFSIIIPTLNEAENLPLLLSDISKQNYEDFEVIVVDAKSTDGTLNQAKKLLAGLNSKTIVSDVKNVCTQRNMAAEKADGDWLVFADADVRLDEDFLEKLAAELSAKKPACAALNFNVATKSKIHAFLNKWLFHYMTMTTFLGFPRVIESVFICRSAIFQKVGGFDDKLKVNEGTEFVARARNLGLKFAILKKVYYLLNPRRIEQQGSVRWIVYQVLIEFFHLMKMEGSSTLFSKLYPMDDRYR